MIKRCSIGVGSAAQFLRIYPKADIQANNAVFWMAGPVADMDEETLDGDLDKNLL